jgi:hypothetical protein
MSDMKHLLDIVEEFSEEEGLVEAQDSFDIELGEDLIIETGVIDINEDGILVEGDEETLRLLAEHGVILEETDWSKYDEPTVSRIAKGITKPVDRTDYNVPPAMRDPDQGKPGFEKRRSRIMKGLEKVSEEEVEESGLQAYLGNKKYGKAGMDALRKAGREGVSKEKMAQIRAKYDKLDEVWDDEAGYDTDDPKHPDYAERRAERAEHEHDRKREKEIDEAKYQGREVPLGKPMAGDVKKSKVYVRGPKGNVVKVNFGDKKMKIKKSNPKRRKSFRARHNCKNPGPRWKARYWSCRAW